MDLTAQNLADIAKAVATYKVNINPGEGKTPDMQPWANVDAYGRNERYAAIEAARAAQTAAKAAEVAARSLLPYLIAEAAEVPPTPEAVADALMQKLQASGVQETAVALFTLLGPQRAAEIAAIWEQQGQLPS